MTKERRQELLRAGFWHDVKPYENAAAVMREDFAHVRIQPLAWGELRSLLVDAAVLLQVVDDGRAGASQDHTCSTCRHLTVYVHQNLCDHRESPVYDLGTAKPETFGCVFWEPLAPETKGETR